MMGDKRTGAGIREHGINPDWGKPYNPTTGSKGKKIAYSPTDPELYTVTTSTSNAESSRLSKRLAKFDIAHTAVHEDFVPYKGAAKDWLKYHMTYLARLNGSCGPGPSTILVGAAWQYAASRYFWDLAAKVCNPDLFVLASRFAADARSALTSAYELAHKEAKVKPQTSPHIALQQALRDSSVEMSELPQLPGKMPQFAPKRPIGRPKKARIGEPEI